MELLIKILLGAAFIVIGVAMDGLAVWLLWGWFVVPTFHFLALSFMQAVGLSLITGLLTLQFVPKQLDDDEQLAQFLSFVFLNPIIFIALGWVIHFFI